VRHRLVAPCAAAGLACAALSAGAAAAVPYEVQVPLLLKALTYDRSLKSRVGDQVRIAVVVPPKSLGAIEELRSSLAGMPERTLNGLPVVFKEFDPAALDDALRAGRWAAVYALPGHSSADLGTIKRACGARQVLGVAAQVDDVERGLALGIAAQAGKPQIVVNLPSVKAFGSEFDLALLRLARVIQ
jgi:hypothetical protein